MDQTASETTTVADLTRHVGGYPIDLGAVVEVLDLADTVLADKGGRDYRGDLTQQEVSAILRAHVADGHQH